MAGIQEIADLTGLSKATVSRALRGLPVVAPSTVVAVRDAAESLGYIPSASASGLATAAHSCTAGCSLTAFSTSAGPMR